MSDGALSGPVSAEHSAELLVTAREGVGDGVVSLTFADPDGAQLPPWTPGAHIDVIFSDSLVRQYSLCGSPADRTCWRVAVLLEPNGRGGSTRAHELQVGDRVQVRGPRNHFALIRSPRYLFIAGGIGITPLRPMIDAAAAEGAQWQLYYGGRTRGSMAFVDDLAAHGAPVTIWPENERGLLPLSDLLGTPSADTLVYCCGPEPLLAAVEAMCSSWPHGALHVERFTAKPQEDTEGGDVAPFEVFCQKSDVTVTVLPGTSILDTLDDNGVSVLSSCQEGVCGTCETHVLEGVPDHRDSLLTDDERAANDYMMICVSRSRTPRLVLDL